MNDSLSILELPSIVTLLFERTHRSLLPGAQGPLGLFVRYLRRKPARGLAVIYSVDEVKRVGSAGHASDPNRSVSLTLDEKALEGAHIRFSSTDAQQASVEVQPSGVLRAENLGLSVQAFPADSSLPALAASCDTTQGSPLFQALQEASRMQLGDETWRLVSARAVPVRYKPANRCVIRYHLTLEHPVGEAPLRKNLVLFGKVYADPEQARTVQAMQQQIYDEHAQAHRSFLRSGGRGHRGVDSQRDHRPGDDDRPPRQGRGDAARRGAADRGPPPAGLMSGDPSRRSRTRAPSR